MISAPFIRPELSDALRRGREKIDRLMEDEDRLAAGRVLVQGASDHPFVHRVHSG